eukprot:TRINITY_DN2792_c0_g1_i1.p1 TRINITY_DN2792_c0_g1~~TRINITY_DN2792_c0_g1_i1.p1  ORF type:complete len:221 (-),score=52.32 TRINITY_DN2792_c0_g1_i1:55-717(-)
MKDLHILSILILAVFLAISAPHASDAQHAGIPTLDMIQSMGNPGAPIMLEAFIDFQCPYSRKAWPTLMELFNHYGPQNMYFVTTVFPLPFHHNAFFASQAAIAVVNITQDSSMFWKYTDKLFIEQENWGDSPTESMTALQVIDMLGGYAVECCGVNKSAFNSQMGFTGPQNHQARIMWGKACTLGVYGTPIFRVNNIYVPAAGSAWNVSDWTQLLDPLLV